MADTADQADAHRDFDCSRESTNFSGGFCREACVVSPMCRSGTPPHVA